jgi:hypothetical protein
MPLIKYPKPVEIPPPPTGGGFNRTNLKEQILLDGPEVYFRFDETSGPTALDYSGFDRHGTYGSTAQFNRDGIGDGMRSVYDPKLSYTYPVPSRQDQNGNTLTKPDFSAVCLIRLLSGTNKGVIFNTGTSASGVLLGKGYDGNPDNNGNVLVALANYEAYLNCNSQFASGINLLGMTVRARDNQMNFYLNGLLVYTVTQNWRALVGSGTVGFTENEAFGHALCEYGEFAFFFSELPPSRMATYWKAVQLTL